MKNTCQISTTPSSSDYKTNMNIMMMIIMMMMMVMMSIAINTVTGSPSYILTFEK